MPSSTGHGHSGCWLGSALAEAEETPTERRNAIVLLFAVHRLLAGIANNVNQMAKATNAAGDVQAEMVATRRAARRAPRSASTPRRTCWGSGRDPARCVR